MTTNEKGKFNGRVAFVTGAASGIGREAALAFAREGASVVAADVSEHGNRETVRLIEQLGGRALAVRCDVTRAEEVKAAIAKPEEIAAAVIFLCSDAAAFMVGHAMVIDGGQTIQ